MQSLWSLNTNLPNGTEPRPSLTGDVSTDVCIIGAGMAGSLIGHELKRRGISSVLLERDRIGSGVTKGTTAKITAQHGLIYRRLITELGKKAAHQYAESNARAVERFTEIVERSQIDCDFVRMPSYVYSLDQTNHLCEEVKAAVSLGLNAELTTETTLPFPVKGAVRFPNQAACHPLRFLHGVTAQLNVYEHTVVKDIRRGLVTTENGRVHAKRVVIATHYPILNVPGWYFLRMYQQRSYLLALRSRTGDPPLGASLDGMYIDADETGLTFRPCGEYLLLGGAGHRTGQHEAGGSYRRLLQAASHCYPHAKRVCEWSAQDCMTLDGVPYIGKYASSEPWLYVATGFNKWGMTGSMAAAMILSSAIAGKRSPFADVYSPQRLILNKRTISNFTKNSGKSVKGLLQSHLMPGRQDLAFLSKGQGGIVRYEGRKVGAYRDENGVLFLVSPKCTHLGCQLEWNPDEKTWDCPCTVLALAMTDM